MNTIERWLNEKDLSGPNLTREQRNELVQLIGNFNSLKTALNALRKPLGCFCDADLGMGNGSHPSHTPECNHALKALGLNL